GSDAAVIGVGSLSRHAATALAILSEMVVRPAFREADFLRVRQLRLHRLTQIRDVPSAMADRAFIKLLYGDHPYGHPPIGAERTLAAITVDDVREFHRRGVVPAASTLIAVGDCTHEQVRDLAVAAFAGWSGEPGTAQSTDGRLPQPARLNVVPRPGAP